MRIIHNELSNNIHVPKFICDMELHEQLRGTPLPNNFNFMYIVGKARSGKSSLAISLLSQIRPKIYRKVFNNIITFVPRSSLASLKKNVFEDIDEAKKFDELNHHNLEIVQTMLDDFRENDEKTLIYMDDVTASLKDNEVQRDLKQIVFNRRHKFTSIWVLAQSYLSLPRDLRKQVTHIVLFKPSLMEWKCFVEENLSFLDKQQIKQLYKLVYQNPHDFLYFNTETNQIYRKFDEIILDEDSDSESEK